MPRIIVADIENWDTLMELPYVLKKGGFEIDVYCSEKSWLIKNSHYNKWIKAPDNELMYTEQLIKLIEDDFDYYDWVMIGDEKALFLMNEAIDSEKLFKKILPLTKIENRKILASKRGLSELCTKYNIITPNYYVCEKGEDVNFSNTKLQFPLLLKQDLSWGGGGIMLCNHNEEFVANMKKRNPEFDTVIQEFIEGDDIGVEALFYNGELIECNIGLIKTYFKSKFSFTTKRHYSTNERIEEELRNVGKQIGIHGFASIQYVYDRSTNSYYLLEVDIRPNFWVAYGRFTGHDFSKAIHSIFNPNSIQKDIAKKNGSSVEVSIFYRDIIACVKQKNIKGLFYWIFNYKGYWRFIPLNDLKLFKNILHSLFVKKMRS